MFLGGAGKGGGANQISLSARTETVLVELPPKQGVLIRMRAGGRNIPGPGRHAVKESRPMEGPPSPPGTTSKRLNWQPLSLDVDADARVDLSAVVGNQEHVSVCTLRGIYAETKQDAMLVLNSAEPHRVWLNGPVIHEQKAASVQEAKAVIPVTREAGWNKLLIRVSHGPGPISVSVRLLERAAANSSEP